MANNLHHLGGTLARCIPMIQAMSALFLFQARHAL
jgi:hypothetical protein